MVLADFSFPGDKYKELEKSEKEKVDEAVRFLKNIHVEDGDHETIRRLEKEELARRGFSV